MLLRTWALAVVMTGGLLAWRTVYSPAVGRHLYNLPADQRAWKDFLVRPFAALAVPFRTEAGMPVEAYLAGLALLLVVGALLSHMWTRRLDSDDLTPTGRRHTLILGIGWVTISTLPLLTQFYVSPTLQGGRYVYLPAAGFAILLSAAVAGPVRRVAPALFGLVLLLGIYVGALRHERTVWRHAAAVRDGLLEQASAVVRSKRCRSLEVANAPGDVDGAFVFREGLADALSDLAYHPDGVACLVRWDGASLKPAPSEPAR